MKNTALNNLMYTGIVTLSQYIGSKKIKIAQFHNAGGNPLFNFISDCLAGDFEVAKLARPTKIMLIQATESEDREQGTVSVEYDRRSGFIYLLTTPEKVYDNSRGIVRYSFAMSRDLLEGTEFNGIGLYANSATEEDVAQFAAFCKVSDIKNKLTDSSIMIVDWELRISNIPGISNQV